MWRRVKNPSSSDAAVNDLDSLSGRLSLYVHVPFCLKRCAYCDFASEVKTASRVDAYLRCLAKEASASDRRGASLHTVYVGGGTPTSLTDAEMNRIFEVIRSSFDTTTTEEWTVEANPGTIDVAKLSALRAAGADRLSIGVQSFSDELLGTVGRTHDSTQAVAAVSDARAAGFGRVSIDLMYALPAQTLADVRHDAARAAALGVDHVSVYGLTYECGTRMTALRDAHDVKPADEELERAMYVTLIDELQREEYEQYEIASFARGGRRALHNTVYWTGGEYLGIGPSAASFLAGERSSNHADLDAYAAALDAGRRPVAHSECLTGERAAREALVLGLRLRRGVDAEEFARRTGFDVSGLLDHRLIDDGWLAWEDGRLVLAQTALPVADEIFAKLV
jgi:oxygen-independent coproporphyrinogen-3 oxidase